MQAAAEHAPGGEGEHAAAARPGSVSGSVAGSLMSMGRAGASPMRSRNSFGQHPTVVEALPMDPRASGSVDWK